MTLQVLLKEFYSTVTFLYYQIIFEFYVKESIGVLVKNLIFDRLQDNGYSLRD